MPTLKDDAVCLRRWDFSETSQTVSLFTRGHGVVRGLAKGAKRRTSSFSGGFDVLIRGQLVAIVKPGRELATLTEWHITAIYRAIRQRLDANRAGLYMADLVHHMVRDHDPHPILFDSLIAALEALDAAPGVPAALLRFQWSLLRETGFAPELDVDASTGEALPADAITLAFSSPDGGLVADTGAPGRWRVRRATVDALRHVASDAAGEPSDAETVHRANRLLSVYIRDVVGSEPNTMRWMFGNEGR